MWNLPSFFYAHACARDVYVPFYASSHQIHFSCAEPLNYAILKHLYLHDYDVLCHAHGYGVYVRGDAHVHVDEVPHTSNLFSFTIL
jgi:hypothetical protein